MYIRILRAHSHMSDEPGRQDDGTGTEARSKRLVRSGGCEDVVICRAFLLPCTCQSDLVLELTDSTAAYLGTRGHRRVENTSF